MASLYGRGTISPVKDSKGNIKKNKWRIYFSYGTSPMTGKPLRHTETFTGTHKQAELRVEELRREYAGGKAPNADKLTYAELSALWLKSREYAVKRGTLREATFAVDKRIAKHLVPALGNYKVSDITPLMVAQVYRDLEGTTGASTVHKCHRQLSQVLGYAVRNDVLMRNPVDRLDRHDIPKEPTPDTSDKRLSESETRRFFDMALQEKPNGASMAMLLGICTGMRRGELLGLTWEHVHLDSEPPYLENVQQYTKQGTIAPRKTDKSGKGEPLGKDIYFGEKIAALLAVWKQGQEKELSGFGIEQTGKTPVCANQLGGFYNVDNFNRYFRRFCVNHGFGRYYDEQGREIVRIDLDEQGNPTAEPPANAHIIYYNAENWPVDETGRKYSRTYKRPEITKHHKGFSPHGMRDTFFTNMFDKLDQKTLQYLGGWVSLRMLDRYAKTKPENVIAAGQVIDSLAAVSPALIQG